MRTLQELFDKGIVMLLSETIVVTRVGNLTKYTDLVFAKPKTVTEIKIDKLNFYYEGVDFIKCFLREMNEETFSIHFHYVDRINNLWGIIGRDIETEVIKNHDERTGITHNSPGIQTINTTFAIPKRIPNEH